jgi:hypothetical protein
MKLIKLFAVVFVVFIALIGLTLGWMLRIQTKVGSGTVDILYVVTRPLFLLGFAAVAGGPSLQLRLAQDSRRERGRGRGRDLFRSVGRREWEDRGRQE